MISVAILHEVQCDIATIDPHQPAPVEGLRTTLNVGRAKSLKRGHASFRLGHGKSHDADASGRNEAVPANGHHKPCHGEAPHLDLRERLAKLVGLGHEQCGDEHFATLPIYPKGRVQDARIKFEESHALR